MWMLETRAKTMTAIPTGPLWRIASIELVIQLSCEAAPNPHSFAYMRTKKERMGHALSLGQGDGTDQTKAQPAVRSRGIASDMSGFNGRDHNRTVDVPPRASGIEAQL
jgi:hypothetical protein